MRWVIMEDVMIVCVCDGCSCTWLSSLTGKIGGCGRDFYLVAGAGLSEGCIV